MSSMNDKLLVAIRAFNDKIARIQKANPQLAPYQPKMIDVNEKLQQYRGRDNDRKRLIRALHRYLEPGAEMPYTTK